MDIHATACAGIAVLSAIVAAFVIELARGRSGSPFDWLGAIGRMAYLIAIAVSRIRG